MALFGNNQNRGQNLDKGNTSGRKLNFSDSLKYVDDYKTELVTDERGKTRRKVVYIGIWYAIKNAGRKERIKLFTVLGLCLVAPCCLVGMLLNWNVADVWYTVVIPKAAALFPMLYLLMGASELPYKLKPMHRSKYYHSFIRISRSSVAVIAFVAISQIVELVYRIVNKNWLFMRTEWLSPVLAAVLIAALIAVIRILYSIDITELQNDEYKPEKI